LLNPANHVQLGEFLPPPLCIGFLRRLFDLIEHPIGIDITPIANTDVPLLDILENYLLIIPIDSDGFDIL